MISGWFSGQPVAKAVTKSAMSIDLSLLAILTCSSPNRRPFRIVQERAFLERLMPPANGGDLI
jgi:hypothetical protein